MLTCSTSFSERAIYTLSVRIPQPHYQTIERNTGNGKQKKASMERAARLRKNHWPCFCNPLVPHHQIQQDRNTEILRGE